MKRKQREQSTRPSSEPRTLEPNRLSTARGGGDLSIAIRIATPLTPDMPFQHNELLVRL